MSFELISLAVDSMTPPNKPPPLRPRAPIISAERLIIYIRNPTKKTQVSKQRPHVSGVFNKSHVLLMLSDKYTITFAQLHCIHSH